MDSKVLINGLKFAIEYELTTKEMKVLILFLEKPLTNSEVAKILEANPTTLPKTIQRLKLKRLLVLKDRDSQGNNLLEFNPKLLK